VAIHEYQELDPGVLRRIATERHADWIACCRELGLRICP